MWGSWREVAFLRHTDTRQEERGGGGGGLVTFCWGRTGRSQLPHRWKASTGYLDVGIIVSASRASRSHLDNQVLKIQPSEHPNLSVINFFKSQFQAYKWFSLQYNSCDGLWGYYALLKCFILGCNLRILWPSLINRTPQNYAIVNFWHPLSKSWLRPWWELSYQPLHDSQKLDKLSHKEWGEETALVNFWEHQYAYKQHGDHQKIGNPFLIWKPSNVDFDLYLSHEKHTWHCPAPLP